MTPEPAPRRCAVCLAPLPEHRRGRPATYCSSRCAARAKRLRRSVIPMLEHAVSWDELPLEYNRRAREIAASLRVQASAIANGRYHEAIGLRLEEVAVQLANAGNRRGAEQARAEAARLRGGGASSS